METTAVSASSQTSFSREDDDILLNILNLIPSILEAHQTPFKKHQLPDLIKRKLYSVLIEQNKDWRHPRIQTCRRLGVLNRSLYCGGVKPIDHNADDLLDTSTRKKKKTGLMARFEAAAANNDDDAGFSTIFGSPPLHTGLRSPGTPTAARGEMRRVTFAPRKLFPSETGKRKAAVTSNVDDIFSDGEFGVAAESTKDVSGSVPASIHTPKPKKRQTKSEAVCPTTDQTLATSSPKKDVRTVPEVVSGGRPRSARLSSRLIAIPSRIISPSKPSRTAASSTMVSPPSADILEVKSAPRLN